MTLFLFLLSCVELSSKYATDDDGDGYSEFQGDCDDANRFISPVQLNTVTESTTTATPLSIRIQKMQGLGIQTTTKMDMG